MKDEEDADDALSSASNDDCFASGCVASAAFKLAFVSASVSASIFE